MKDVLKARASALLAAQVLDRDKTPGNLAEAANHLREALRLVECARDYARDQYEREAGNRLRSAPMFTEARRAEVAKLAHLTPGEASLIGSIDCPLEKHHCNELPIICEQHPL